MFKILVFLISFISLLDLTVAQLVQDGQCNPNIQLVSNFNVTNFAGAWYEIARFPSELQNGECVSNDFVVNNHTYKLYKTIIYNQRSTTVVGNATLPENRRGIINVDLSNGAGATFSTTYQVLDVVYNDFALLHNCRNLNSTHKQIYSWKLSRHQTGLSQAAVARINAVVSNTTELFEDYYDTTDQTSRGCFHYPVFNQLSNPIELIGLCDTTIRAKPYFNVTAYLGKWYDIESYPQAFQNGECARAQYSAGFNVLDVLNTQVVNRTLDARTATAVLASNDGSGILKVTFPFGNARNVVNYYVLETDYTSFSLVYSCQNLPNARRRVSSWKLSRGKVLPSKAAPIIDNIINSTQGLIQEYYRPISQSDEDCFYIPEVNKNKAPLFRGQCEITTGMQGFNAQKYLGWWHEIESYPTDNYIGDCISSIFKSVGNQYQVVGINVFNNSAQVNTSVVTISADGRIRKVLSNGVVADIWVLETDYETYSLLYSCETVTSDYKRVWSAKNSKSRQLTAAAQQAVASIINRTETLESQFYIPVNQSDKACFHYPEQDGMQIILPGQCDPNIPVLQNFEPANFAGAWYEIARFPSELQNGECVSNTFVRNNHTYKLHKTIIYNERSTTVVGNATIPENRRGIINVDLSNGAGATFSTTYQVLDVVYNDFALLHNCRNLNSTHRQIYSWKLSRRQTGLSRAAVARINAVVSNTTELFEDYYDTTDQTSRGCFHYPVFNQLPNSIVLIGLCDTTIRAKPYFNVTAYLGKWYDIESYPQAFQNGECARAQYSVDFNVLDVLNTQVVNRTLDARTATAVLASNDGSGILKVTFPFGNARNVVNYYVLETDYTSFSLVYSCQNLPNARRRVSSWKLSRGKVLPSKAAPIIDNIINSTQGLIQEYYRPISQSDEDCFYIPEVNKNKAPLFRGQCEITTGMQGFNAQKYLGWWHEIESYPTDNYIGDCISSIFKSVGNQYQVVGINVFNNSAQVNTSVVTISADGRIRKVLSNGVVADIWVLETDYETYSLLYSCETVTSDYKRVWSAKNSKSRQLTAAAQQAVASIINRTETLESQFYIPVNQSDKACFHYPEQDGMQIILPGQCDPNIPVLQNFEPANFAGAWYEIARFPSELQNGECVSNTFVRNNHTYKLHKTIIYNERSTTVVGNATIPENRRGIINVDLSNGAGATFSTTYQVLDVVYNDFALLHNCRNLNSTHRQIYSWKLSRRQTGLSRAAVARINAVVSNTTELFEDYYDTTDQTSRGCFHYPVFNQLPNSIVLIGLCDTTIRAKPYFNVTAYLGKWYDIESYPQAFQNGECARAQYSVDFNVLDVLNTQVVNRTLDARTATAVLASNDGSGILKVTFPFGNARNVVNYYVLETDYTSFSLVYSCQNLPNARRRVSSWKLSRGKVLPSKAAPIIDNIINSTQGLIQEYYRPISQSDEDCFYIPEVNKNKAPLFRGQCEITTGMQGFNAQKYLGWWHEIESYPTDNYIGDCISSIFKSVGNQYQVVGINVFNNSAQVNTSVVTISADGRIRKVLSNGVVADIWVLETDYETYSLLYSCETVTSDYKRVWSAKNSKSRQLTAAAQQAVASIINRTETLESQFYIPVNQSDKACFHYPEQDGMQIILPGQCDPNIPVLQNFEPANFAGAWYEIARFPSELQNGECVSNTFVRNNHTYKLHKTIIYNERSTTVVGNATIPENRRGIINVDLSNGAGATFSTTYQVLDVVYNDFALLHNCRNLNSTHRQIYSWKLSRRQTGLSRAAVARINAVVSNTTELFEDYYDTTDQTSRGCFHYPVFNQLPNSIVLIGLCDTTIRAKPYFNVTAYLGKWYDIESYPQAFQNGECARAQYSVDFNVLDVLNTQVVNRTLDARTATAVLASNDGSGILKVTFPFGNARNVVNYYVLETDYTSFSLVYSCQNLPNARRRVSSWKLSRGKVLPSKAAPIIDNIINSTQGLIQEYYRPISQSDEDCFYIPEVNKNKAPLFRGQCEITTGMQGFNAQKYLGWWHEIESYPTDNYIGDCISSIFKSVGNQYQVVGINVFNNSAQVNTSVVTISADGRIRKVLSNGVVADIWVLETDYETYSLLYSCETVTSDYKRVWSAKNSKSRQLTAAAQQAVASIINRTETLESQFYIPVNQSDKACFHYPEQDGMQIILPGQCDPNIPVLQNFEPANFAGAWYEIARFPSELQNGECVSNTFVRNNHTYKLHKTIIYNERSTTVVGNATIPENRRGIINVDLSNGAGATFSTTYQVLDVVYNDFALLHNCRNLNSTHRQIYSWKLSRRQTGLSRAAVARINAVVSNTTELFEDYYDTTDQTSRGCFHYPVFNQLPNSIVLIGLCDTTIRAKPYFNVTAYLGKWYDIESYPQAFQNGECARAQYSVDFNVLDVLNTQVVNRTLDARTATAVLASNDGSGILKVTFPFGNARNVVNYYVLETDYTSFSLVYSCQNLPNARRRVSSWKLSRGKVLPSKAAPIIDNIINSTQGLIQEYYRPISQSDEDCFYIPEVNKNKAPLFRGQCEITTGMQGFNAQKYLGWWHEIESYPTDNYIGDCISSIFKSVGNQYQVVGINVFNNSAQVNTSVVTISADGRIRKVLSNGVVADIWVLETDYETYSLLYSCETVTSDYKRVWSAKNSKSRQLTAAAQQAMASIINRTETLESQFYIPVNQSDKACFHYPEQDGMQIILPGQCDPNIPVLQNFEPANFAGAWYEIARFPSELQNGECVSNTFVRNNHTYKLHKTIIYNERSTTLVGNATLPENRRGIINVDLSNGAGATFSTTYQVLDVVYNDFALLHNCRNLNSTHRQIYSWKLSRRQTGLSRAAVARINAVVSNTTELFEDYYDTTDQTSRGCFHYPVFNQLPNSIVLIGLCDTTIRAKPYFNVTAYLGKWYDIESYPQAFQNGECARAQYSVDFNVLDVLNTQVVNRTLDARTATAVLASNDGSGILKVTFPFGNARNVVNYYVLETDYTSFSLVYSCQNLPNARRRVSSWKLSRGKVLPSNAAPIIDNIINSTQGLIQEYYRPISQSDEDCFYIPEVNKNKAPLFRGQCEITTGMQGFNAQKYLGWWHEIESYPTGNDIGDYVSSTLKSVGNQYQVVGINVFNNSAQVNTSVVTISADGRIRKVLSNGVVADIWVLETDYETYSLLYSCETVTSDYKRVWSAKHSKSRQLTAEAQQALASIINRTETLESQFYIPVNQSDEACFHYPEQDGMQIILPGQCDPNIPVLQNFEPANYTGTWYQIEKYPQSYENGTCIGARYTLDVNTGVVDVLNWQVLNGTLDTIKRTATVNSTDGSAKLIVNLPIRNSNRNLIKSNEDTKPDMVSMELYILKTDYITYSLVYSCVDINPFQRSVGVWKLSRTRTMLENGDSEINSFMRTRQELHQPYFETVEQNNECEEPNSSYLVKSSIIIILICSLLHVLY